MTETIEEDPTPSPSISGSAGLETPPATQAQVAQSKERRESRSAWATRMRSSIPLPLDSDTLSSILGTPTTSAVGPDTAETTHTPTSTKTATVLARNPAASLQKPAFVPLRRPRKSMSMGITTPLKATPSPASTPAMLETPTRLETPTAKETTKPEAPLLDLARETETALTDLTSTPSPASKPTPFPVPVATPSVRLMPAIRRSSFVKTPTFQKLRRPTPQSKRAETSIETPSKKTSEAALETPTKKTSEASIETPSKTTSEATWEILNETPPKPSEKSVSEKLVSSETTKASTQPTVEQTLEPTSENAKASAQDSPRISPEPSIVEVAEAQKGSPTDLAAVNTTETTKSSENEPVQAETDTARQVGSLEVPLSNEVEHTSAIDNISEVEDDEVEDDEVDEPVQITIPNTVPSPSNVPEDDVLISSDDDIPTKPVLRRSARREALKPPTRTGKVTKARGKGKPKATAEIIDASIPVKKKRGRPPKRRMASQVDSEEDDEVVLVDTSVVVEDSEEEQAIKKEPVDEVAPFSISFTPLAKYGGRSTRALRSERLQAEKRSILNEIRPRSRRTRAKAGKRTLINNDEEEDEEEEEEDDVVVDVPDDADSEGFEEDLSGENSVDELELSVTVKEEEEIQLRRSMRLQKQSKRKTPRKTKARKTATSASAETSKDRSASKATTIDLTKPARKTSKKTARKAGKKTANPKVPREPKTPKPVEEPEYWSDGEIKKKPTKRVLENLGSLELERYKSHPTLDNPLKLRIPESLPVDEDGKVMVDPTDIPKYGRGFRPYEIENSEVVIVNPEKFTMADLCGELPIGMIDEKFAKYEEERSRRRKRRDELYKAKKRARLEGKSIEFISQIGSTEQEEAIKEMEEGQKKFTEEIAQQNNATVSAPQMQIVGGEIQVNTESIFVDRHRQAAEELGDSRVVEEETSYSKILNNASYSKHKIAERWDNAETEKFYVALSTWGSDFSILSQLFPGRSRRQLRNKFKLEERKNRVKLDLALERRLAVSAEEYVNVSSTPLVTVKEVDDLIQSIDDDYQQRMKVETDNREKARAVDAANAMREDATNFGGLSTQGFSGGQRKTKSQIRKELQRNEIVLGTIDD